MLGRKVCREGHLMDTSWRKCPVCLAPICGWLVVMHGKNKNKVFTIHEGKTKVGSGTDCEVRVLMDGVSRHHAMIKSMDGKYNVTDLNSIGGTYVNGFQVSNRDVIDGDLLRLGDVEFKFKCL